MTTSADDEGIRAVRDIRERISAEHANDAKTLINHYVAMQERYRNRLLRPVGTRQGDATDGAPDRR